ncbi:MerR family transcriptional regulator [Altererythrobacter sp. SALINAS58]|uniref:MerR family transcriptional regulator n=1 Tax=Alteripontixanthobacter muriae TaxID=2705546 RepID=UPI001576530B|nr:MerR family transcriptional regulator [Alteripontixanthobacter muriae]NTZ42768.1 MerR family transcriptional regulator [Alteripontixanthobacter muriae]
MTDGADRTLFDDGKDGNALRTIGEVAKALSLKTHVLRYWEEQFPQLEPLKRSGGRRYYRPQDIAMLQRIDSLVNHQGYTLKGAKAALGDEAVPQSVPEAQPEAGNPDILRQLKSIRNRLATALAE